mmetsp:Transcript_28073/g.41352  ORF Transcript_28073/g.41352 Transcript_28073/m.41352 type:complete len:317 (+) Transcript_28073:46-996(+)
MRPAYAAHAIRTSYVVRRKYQESASFFVRRVANSAKKVDAYVQGPKTHFGYEEVNVEQKEGKVKKVFESVADSYDVMNDLMSAGLHRYWKDELVRISGVSALAKAARSSGKQFDILDLAGGTGDVSFRFIDAAECVERSKSSGKDSVSVTVCDINPSMLQVGEKRARERYGNALIDKNKSLAFVEGNAQDLPFEDNKFDLFTIAFGLRNVTDVDAALREARRVLKPGGRFMCLEFSRVENDTFRAIYDAYSFHAIPQIGQAVAGDRDSYQYLVESIRKFSTQEELKDRIEAAGFTFPSYANYTGGIVAIHEGYKPI